MARADSPRRLFGFRRAAHDAAFQVGALARQTPARGAAAGCQLKVAAAPRSRGAGCQLSAPRPVPRAAFSGQPAARFPAARQATKNHGGHASRVTIPRGAGVGSFAHASRSDGQRNLLELQALHPAQPSAPVLYSNCALLYTGRSLDQRNALDQRPLVCGGQTRTQRLRLVVSHSTRPPPPPPPRAQLFEGPAVINNNAMLVK